MKIFLDSGDVEETKQAIALLGFLDGQTTNPTLIAKNPATAGKKFTKEEIFSFYRSIVEQISALIPNGSVSIEVYADKSTTADEMFKQGKEMFSWIPNAHIKYSITKAGLEAAQKSIAEGMKVNMTLCFTQEQAAAVYAATLGAKKGAVFISPFVGRLDDIGENGMDLVRNILEMYRQGDGPSPRRSGLRPRGGGHVEVLTASVRNLSHFLKAKSLGSDIITAPLKVLRQWAEQDFDINHELTDVGIKRFSSDWNNLIK